MQKKPYFKAMVTYYATDKGGLVTPISSDFRANLKFPFETKTYIGIQTFSEKEHIFPGDSLSVDITLVNDIFLEKIYEGIDFEISDNSKVIGTGIVSEIYSIT